MFLVLLYTFTFLSIPVSSQQNEFINNGFKDPETNISLSGVALTDKNGRLHLTNETSRLIGHAFYPTPVQFKNSTTGTAFSFSTCFVLSIHPEYLKLGGHGLAFTIAPSKDLKSALPSQYLGLLNSSDASILISLDSNRSAAAAYFDDNSVKHDINLKSGKAILAWMEYDSFTNIINVTLSPSFSKPKTPLLSYQVDLSPIIKENMYVGFSASTGLLASSHYLLGWSFKMNGKAKSLDFDVLPSVPGTKKKNAGLIVSLSVLAVVFTLSSIFIAVLWVRKIMNTEVIETWEIEIGPHRYSYQELKQATRGFKDDELLGFGGFGRVYKGILPNPKIQVAVKRISHGSKQGLRENVSEISSIGRLRHRNLVQLLGWCRRGGDLLLVYDFMPNGSLDKFLFGQPKSLLSLGTEVQDHQRCC
ncbi:L-type lectin-domain containing receptor kinase S.4 [Abeliophyllum distichum]|uniref:L-type lectin-domain containing receptor kinase S.4 n=1 Tax=Abeliophyllum distichum TaxID=126358 RepID=A0ABD1R0D3_9LAMI